MGSTGRAAEAAAAARFARRTGITAAVADALTGPQRAAGYADTLEAVVVNLVSGREPLYALAAWGEDAEVAAGLGDDKAGRALEALWDADPAAVCSRAAVSAARAAGAGLGEVHNGVFCQVGFAGLVMSFLPVWAGKFCQF
jgi:hypothetical protein